MPIFMMTSTAVDRHRFLQDHGTLAAGKDAVRIWGQRRLGELPVVLAKSGAFTSIQVATDPDSLRDLLKQVASSATMLRVYLVDAYDLMPFIGDQQRYLKALARLHMRPYGKPPTAKTVPGTTTVERVDDDAIKALTQSGGGSVDTEFNLFKGGGGSFGGGGAESSFDSDSSSKSSDSMPDFSNVSSGSSSDGGSGGGGGGGGGE